MGLANDRDEKNLFGYLAREFATFDERPIGEVDSLVLSCLSYYRWPGEEVRGPEGLPVRELFRAESFDAMTQGLWDPEGLVHLLASVAASPRFRDVRVCAYADDFDESAEKQCRGLEGGLQHGVRDGRALPARRRLLRGARGAPD